MKKIITLLLLSISLLSYAQYELTELEQQVYEIVKEYKLKIPNQHNFSIIVDKKLSKECKEHSIKMFKTQNVYHDKNRRRSSEIASTTSYFPNGYTSQSIYSLDSLHIRIINKFLTSPKHKEIIDCWSTHIGIGVYVDKKSRVAWTTIRFYCDRDILLKLFAH